MKAIDVLWKTMLENFNHLSFLLMEKVVDVHIENTKKLNKKGIEVSEWMLGAYWG